MDLAQLFKTETPVIGVVHLLPLPASARWGGNLHTVIERAEQEATALATGGVDGIILENFFDAPFSRGRVDSAAVSAMTLVVERIRNLVTVPLGVNVLRNDALSAMAIASCTQSAFIRVNVLSGVMATDQGTIEGCAHELLRYRRELGSDVKIMADVLVKHAHPISTPNLSIAVKDTVERGLADAIILSGWATGNPPSLEDLELARIAAPNTPIFIGSGASLDNINGLKQAADGVIVSSSLKRGGKLKNPIDPVRVGQFIEAIAAPTIAQAVSAANAAAAPLSSTP